MNEMNEDTVCKVGLVTASIRTLMQSGLVIKTEAGSFLTTGAHPRAPTEVTPPAPAQVKPVDPYSLLGLQMQGYQVMAGKTAADDRVMVGGGYYRIEAAKEHGLI
jgi:hypothetical protein